jgi:hypothetical protein
MKTHLFLGASLLLVAGSSLTLTFADEEEVQALVVDNGSGFFPAKDKKPMELICHKGHTILVNANSMQLAGHLAHGDLGGACLQPGEGTNNAGQDL